MDALLKAGVGREIHSTRRVNFLLQYEALHLFLHDLLQGSRSPLTTGALGCR